MERIKPKPEEYDKAERVWRIVRDRLEDTLRARGVEEFEVTLQGSIAKDTWLSGDLDIDVFVLFPKYWRRRLDKAKDLFREAFQDMPVEERYAAHPYIRVLVEDVWVDIVPALKARSSAEIETAVDRTPLHTEYINRVLTREQKDEVRLLKKFLKGIGVYGAEVAVQGFSGYLAELLIARYKCFRYLLEKAARWKPPIVIDLEDHYGGVINEVLERFEDQPLIVVDPVDPKRNVAAAVSKRSLATFVIAARLYVKQPSMHFFEPPEPRLTPERLLWLAGPRAWRILVALYELRRVSPDVGWGLARSTARRLTSFLRERGYNVIDSVGLYCEIDGRVIVLVEVEEHPLPQPRLHIGPDAWSEERAMSFIERSLERGDIGPWIDEDGVLKTLRYRQAYLGIEVERAKPKEAERASWRFLSDLLLEGWLPCKTLWRRVYEFVVKTPVWLAEVAAATKRLVDNAE